MKEFRYPSIEAIEQIERAARRERAEQMVRLAKSAAAKVRGFFSRPVNPLKDARHA